MGCHRTVTMPTGRETRNVSIWAVYVKVNPQWRGHSTNEDRQWNGGTKPPSLQFINPDFFFLLWQLFDIQNEGSTTPGYSLFLVRWFISFCTFFGVGKMFPQYMYIQLVTVVHIGNRETCWKPVLFTTALLVPIVSLTQLQCFRKSRRTEKLTNKSFRLVLTN